MNGAYSIEFKKEIHKRVYVFVLEVLNATKNIGHSIENTILVKQLIRSATSIGANLSEADGSESKKEFVYRVSVAKKEAKETLYWFSLLADHNPANKVILKPLINEVQQLIAILGKIIANSK